MGRFEHPRRRVAAMVLTAVALGATAFLPWGPAVRPVSAASSVNLDQWATLDHAWQNGNLNGNNTRYPEGGIVPFRLAVEGLSKGSHTIRVQYDFTAGGHKAYDFLAAWNGWVSPPMCGSGGGGVSSMCPYLPAPHYGAFPSDGFKTDGLTVRGAEAYSGVIRRLTIWGGSITSISGPTHAGPTSGNSTAEFTVHFTSTGSAVLMAWGGHLAQSRYWEMSIGGPREVPAPSPARRGTCARCSWTGPATGTRIEASSRARSSASCRREHSRRRRPHRNRPGPRPPGHQARDVRAGPRSSRHRTRTTRSRPGLRPPSPVLRPTRPGSGWARRPR